VQALLFDVFGTVVDWRGSIIEELSRFGTDKGIAADWAAFTDDWRGMYQPAMEEVRSGQRPWTILDVLHRESLDKLLAKYRIAGLSEAETDHVNRVWHRLKPWPDAVEGLTRLKSRYIIGTLSNGNVGLLTRMAKNAGLPWDVILGAETAHAYKPVPQAYLANAALLYLDPAQVMLVAAHN
jgi:2-haloacid dehalogenase